MTLKVTFLFIAFVTYVDSQCCPDEAWGSLNNTDYVAKGTIETLEFPPDDTRSGVAAVNNLPIYKVGSGEKCVIWNYDIFGLRAGRTQQMADFLAAHGKSCILLHDPLKNSQFPRIFASHP